jgi:putative DNA primase/helicase
MTLAARNLPVGHHRLACPECTRAKARPRDTALSVDVTPQGGVYLCHRCGWRGGWRSAPQARPARPEVLRRHLTLASHWCDLWRSLPRVTPGTTAHSYLTARGVAIPPPDGDLRYCEALRHPSGYTGPALVALVSDALTGEPMTLHRTWVKADGEKADVDPQRMLLGAHRKQGGVIRLWPDEAITIGLAVAEGIESALAVGTVRQPVWSLIDAGNLGAFPVLGGIEELLIVADNDEAGIRNARECAKRWHRAGKRVRIAIPPKRGTDAADLARAA